MRGGLWAIACVLFFWLCSPVGAQPTVPLPGPEPLRLNALVEVGVDPSGQLSAEQVIRGDALAFRPGRPDEIYPLKGNSRVWLRWQQPSAMAASGRSQMLESYAPGTDRVSLYWLDRQGTLHAQHSGDTIAVNDWPLKGRKPMFVLPRAEDAPVIWVAVGHFHPTSAPLYLWDDRSLTETLQTTGLVVGVYFGLALIVIAVGAAFWVRDRAPLYGWYLAYALLMALTQAVFMGVAGRYLWPFSGEWANLMNFTAPALLTSAGLCLGLSAFDTAQYAPRLAKAVVALAVVSALIGLAYAWLPEPQRFAALNACYLLGYPATVAMSLLARRHGNPHWFLFFLAYSAILIGAALPLMRNLTWLPTSFWTIYTMPIGAALEVPLLLYAVHQRLLDVRESRIRRLASRTLDPVTGLLNPVVFNDRFGQSLMRCRRDRHNVALLYIELLNANTLPQPQGRAGADNAWVEAAYRVRRTTRVVHSLGRAASGDLLLLTSNQTSRAEAMSLAAAVVAAGLRISRHLPGGKLDFRVSVLMVPTDGSSLSELLDRATDMRQREPANSPRRVLTTAPAAAPSR